MNANGVRGLIVLGVALVLGALNFAIVAKERIQREGEVVYLPLAPVDPRSLMQGDYMALRFALVQALERSNERGAAGDAVQLPPREGETRFADVVLDANHVASLAAADAAGHIKLRYRIRNSHVWLGTNAFFFEEGSDQRFNGARYGEFRVDRQSGEAVLVGLRDTALKAM
jgi:uncharacterized membrane-anchored protein